MITKNLSKDDIDEVWDLINPTLYPKMEDQMQDVSDAKRITTDRHGRLKIKKSKNIDTSINIGDSVTNGKDRGEVIDIDNDLVCVRLYENGDILVWSISNIRRYVK